MDPLAHRKLVVDELPDTLPGSLVLVHTGPCYTQSRYWNLEHTFDLLRRKGLTQCKKGWLKFSKALLDKAAVDRDSYIVYATDVPKHCWRHCASTRALLILFGQQADICSGVFADVYLSYLINI